jgi:diaminopimelate decarboxylase
MQIRANVRRLRAAFEERWAQVTLLFATKANSNLAIRRILVQEGTGGDCFGLGELELSLRAGVPREKLVMNGSNKQSEAVRAAIDCGVTLNIDDPSELDSTAAIAEELGRRAHICLRLLPFSYVDPATLAPDLCQIAADRSHDKWGMDRQTLHEIVPRALADERLRLRGLHLHVSRLRPTTEHFTLAAQLVAVCMTELRDMYGWEPELLDFGGGYAHERDPESGEPAGSHPVATPEEYAEAITATLRAALAERRLREPHLLLEPGRRLVSNATVLLTRVGVVKRLPSGVATWVNVDASTNHCPRAPLQGYYYEIVHATKGCSVPEMTANVVGPTCVVDLLGEGRSLPAVATGDLLAVLDVGGYAEVLSNQFNMLPRPANVLVTDSDSVIIRRPESIDDMLATQVVPAHLALGVAAGVDGSSAYGRAAADRRRRGGE